MRIDAGDVSRRSFGQLFRATTALAITNSTAAQARIEPAVPNPAM
jgi:hypothetical protein